MSCKDIIVLVALFAIAAAIKEDPSYPPYHHGHQHHHDFVPIPTDSEVAPTPVEQPLPVQEDIGDDQNEVDDEQSENVAAKKVTLKIRQEETASEVEEPQNELKTNAGWVDCNFNTLPRLSCFDCKTRMICKYPGGGKLVGCNYALKPYCNNGICSAVPSAGCA